MDKSGAEKAREAAETGAQRGAERAPYMRFAPPPVTQRDGEFAYDFNYGARVVVPEGPWRVKLIDRAACMTVYDAKASGVMVRSSKVYFVDFRIEVWREEEGKDAALVFSHDYDARDKNVLMKFPTAALDDVLAWFPYAEEFRKKHGCRLYAAMDQKVADILADTYPEIHFLGPEEQPEDLYATYYIGLFAPWDNRDLQPTDWRVTGLQAHAADLLGLSYTPIPVRLKAKKAFRSGAPYVCIATQATAQCKYWNNARGWMDVIAWLKERGYRVLCIDRDRTTVHGIYGNSIPYGAEDFTGNRPLQERVDVLAGAEFFIGLTSGLSWLAWGVGIPVVMIAGFTARINEFPTPYRVQQFHTCNSCANDMRNPEHYGDFAACPHHAGTDREFECTRFISAELVEKMIERLLAEKKRGR